MPVPSTKVSPASMASAGNNAPSPLPCSYDQVSNPGGGSFRVEQAVDIIRHHNQLAHALGQGQIVPGPEQLAAAPASPATVQLLLDASPPPPLVAAADQPAGR